MLGKGMKEVRSDGRMVEMEKDQISASGAKCPESTGNRDVSGNALLLFRCSMSISFPFLSETTLRLLLLLDQFRDTFALLLNVLQSKSVHLFALHKHHNQISPPQTFRAMKIRANLISDSILSAVTTDETDPAKRKNALRRALRAILAFFSLFKLLLARYRHQDFQDMRKNVWKLDEEEYKSSFSTQQSDLGDGGQQDRDQSSPNGKGKDVQLQPAGDLGYSGSTFFTTANSKYLIKSLPRRFEHEFFTHELLEPYMYHMKEFPHSLLVRITDMVYTPKATLGGIIGTAPTHHIIMENLLYGQQADGEWGSRKWETYDLKPNDYFFPERDIADGKLAPESVKDKLIDEFPDRIKVSAADKERLLALLEADTKLLAANNAIDYSLFLVRYPGPSVRGGAATPASVKSDAESWRTGLDDVEGKWTYRLIVLDFFWARHKFRAQAMTSLVKTFNKMAHKGPMSITANPLEYRKRFLDMVKTIVVDA